jgi:chorismate mutase
MEKRGKLNLEIAEMKHRNAKMPKELSQREKEVKIN